MDAAEERAAAPAPETEVAPAAPDASSAPEVLDTLDAPAPGAPQAQEAPSPPVVPTAPDAIVAPDASGAPDATQEGEQAEETGGTFESFGLSAPVLRALGELGFEGPTPIQRDTIPPLVAGRDVIAQAQTGTGKTAAFGIPLVEHVNPEVRRPQGLVLAPTRELAVQVADHLHQIGKHRGIRVLPVYGGQPIERQLRGLREGVHVAVGTPGRVLDHLRRGTLDLAAVRMAILDEADEMLDMGFLEDMEAILDALREARAEEPTQIGLFSATLPAPVRQLAGRFLRDPVRIDVAPEQVTVPQIEQVAYEISGLDKLEGLARVLDVEAPGSAIVFCATRRGVDEVADRLSVRGYRVAPLHGDMAQAERERVMRRFREGQVEVLVATDVAARGLDIESVTHVINFDIPWDPESYVHRIGRTGRAGRAGDAITLATPRDYRLLRLIEQTVRTRITRKRLPSLADVATRRRDAAKAAVARVLDGGELDTYLTLAGELGDEHDPVEVAAAALRLWDLARSAAAGGDGATLAGAIGAAAEEARLEEERRAAHARREEARRAADEFGADGLAPEPGMTRLFIALGRRDGLRPQDLVGAIANEAGLQGRDVGAIDIYDRFAFVEVPSGVTERVLEALTQTTLRGRPIGARLATPAESQRPRRTPARGERRPRDRRPPEWSGSPWGPGRPGGSGDSGRPGGPAGDREQRRQRWREDERERRGDDGRGVERRARDSRAEADAPRTPRGYGRVLRAALPRRGLRTRAPRPQGLAVDREGEPSPPPRERRPRDARLRDER
jgi:ATP-dependent RNA helicase DeaD